MFTSKQARLVATIIAVVRQSGLWYTERRFKKHPLAIIALFCFLGSYVFQNVAMFLSKDNKEYLFEVFSVISFCGMGILKYISLSYNREIWISLLNKMKVLEQEQLKRDEKLSTVEYESDSESDDQVPNLISVYTKKFQKAGATLSRMYCFTGVIFILSPFIEYAFALIRGIKQDRYPHILPSWNPFDNVHLVFYLIVVIIEAVAAVYCVCVHIAFDLTVIGVMIYICGQFSSLVYQSERIGGKGNIYFLSKRRDLRAHARIAHCHRLHIQLLSFIKVFNSLLKNILGFYFLLATLTLCTVAVRLKSEQMGTMELVSLLQYMCATLIQLFIYCSYGDAVCNECSISAGHGPFATAIWCLSPKIRRELVILGCGMMKNNRLQAGLFNTVNLVSFIQIVRAAYSYYAVLGKNNS